jgi:Holliday junction resolvasome RuvABC endonuclease subunit
VTGAILALDLGTRTGWASWDGTRRESGVQVFDVKRGESPGMRFVRFNRWLGELLTRPSYGIVGHVPVNHFDLVVYEAAHHRGGAATEVCVGMVTRVLEACALRGIEHASVHSATLKKFATSNGRASKEEMLKAVNERFCGSLYRGPVSDDNEADAIALLEYAKAEIVGVEAR